MLIETFSHALKDITFRRIKNSLSNNDQQLSQLSLQVASLIQQILSRSIKYQKSSFKKLIQIQ